MLNYQIIFVSFSSFQCIIKIKTAYHIFAHRWEWYIVRLLVDRPTFKKILNLQKEVQCPQTKTNPNSPAVSQVVDVGTANQGTWLWGTASTARFLIFFFLSILFYKKCKYILDIALQKILKFSFHVQHRNKVFRILSSTRKFLIHFFLFDWRRKNSEEFRKKIVEGSIVPCLVGGYYMSHQKKK